MNFIKMPTAGTPYRCSDLFFAKLGMFRSRRIIDEFSELLKNYLKVDHLALVNSGTTANAIIYKVLKDIRKRAEQIEVILPAYTAPSLLLPIKAEGLKAVLVDIDPETFNLDVKKIKAKISENTLAIMPIHMFGLPCEVDSILEMIHDTDIFVLEDGASALGTQVNNQHIGTRAPFGFYSMNRGKNVSTLAGGIITWKDSDLTPIFEHYLNELEALSPLAVFVMFLKFSALTLAVRPLPYTVLNRLISQFKYTTLHTHFDSFPYTPMQAGLGLNLWKRIEYLDQKRITNGIALGKTFENRAGFKIASIPDGAEVAFNQYPVVMSDLDQRANLMQCIEKQGLEATTLYDHPLHHIFPNLDDSDSTSDPFPEATYLAEHLLLIPPHAQIQKKHIKIFQECVNSISRA